MLFVELAEFLSDIVNSWCVSPRPPRWFSGAGQCESLSKPPRAPVCSGGLGIQGCWVAVAEPRAQRCYIVAVGPGVPGCGSGSKHPGVSDCSCWAGLAKSWQQGQGCQVVVVESDTPVCGLGVLCNGHSSQPPPKVDSADPPKKSLCFLFYRSTAKDLPVGK